MRGESSCEGNDSGDGGRDIESRLENICGNT